VSAAQKNQKPAAGTAGFNERENRQMESTTNGIVRISELDMGHGLVKTVDARELHRKLGSMTDGNIPQKPVYSIEFKSGDEIREERLGSGLRERSALRIFRAEAARRDCSWAALIQTDGNGHRNVVEALRK